MQISGLGRISAHTLSQMPQPLSLPLRQIVGYRTWNRAVTGIQTSPRREREREGERRREGVGGGEREIGKDREREGGGGREGRREEEMEVILTERNGGRGSANPESHNASWSAFHMGPLLKLPEIFQMRKKISVSRNGLREATEKWNDQK